MGQYANWLLFQSILVSKKIIVVRIKIIIMMIIIIHYRSTSSLQKNWHISNFPKQDWGFVVTISLSLYLQQYHPDTPRKSEKTLDRSCSIWFLNNCGKVEGQGQITLLRTVLWVDFLYTDFFCSIIWLQCIKFNAFKWV